MRLYYKIAVSTIYTMQNGTKKDIWKSMSIFILTVNLMYNLLTIWLILDSYFFKGFMDFLAVDFHFGKYNGLIYILLYCFLPIFMFNYISIFKKEKYRYLIEKFPNSFNKKLFLIHLIVSWALLYVVFISIV
jgi:hypothetical protein